MALDSELADAHEAAAELGARQEQRLAVLGSKASVSEWVWKSSSELASSEESAPTGGGLSGRALPIAALASFLLARHTLRTKRSA